MRNLKISIDNLLQKEKELNLEYINVGKINAIDFDNLSKLCVIRKLTDEDITRYENNKVKIIVGSSENENIQLFKLGTKFHLINKIKKELRSVN